MEKNIFEILPVNLFESLFEKGGGYMNISNKFYWHSECKNMAKEYAKIFRMPQRCQMNIWIYSTEKVRLIFTNMNKLAAKCSNIFECPNIHYTLHVDSKLQNF